LYALYLFFSLNYIVNQSVTAVIFGKTEKIN
jgi:hypothetical protein